MREKNNMSKNDELAALKAQLAAVEAQLAAAKKVTETQFRTEMTQSPNNFHVAYNQLFSADFVRENFEQFFVRSESIVSKNRTSVIDVYDVALKDALKTYILSKLKA